MNTQVLLVEDDSAIMDILTLFLQYEGFEVLKARSVAGALEILKAQSPDIVLLDYMLQDDTAEPVVEYMQQQNRGIPIILLTAADDPSGKARRVGADYVIAKPFELESLVSSVRGAIKARSQGASTFFSGISTPNPVLAV